MNDSKRTVVAGVFGVVVGCAAGAAMTAVLAKRASYYWAMEQLAATAAAFELSSRNDASTQNGANSEDRLMAADLIRKSLSASSPAELSWRLATPFSMITDVIISPTAPLISNSDVYGSTRPAMK